MRPFLSCWPVLVGGMLVLAPNPAAGVQEAPVVGGDGTVRPTATAVRTQVPIVIDGVPDEEAWEVAPPLTGFVQQDPLEGAPASQRTEVRVLYDDDALFIAAWLLDSEPDRIVPGERGRDRSLDEGDAFFVVFDTFHDRQNGYLFATNPLGVEYDGHITMDGHPGGPGRGQSGTSGGGFNINWAGSWDVATSRDDRGWYVEMRIPFSTLRYASGPDQEWGFNVARYIRRTNERAFWSSVPRQYDIHRVSLAGTLRGIQVPSQRAASVTPYVLQGAQREYAVDDAFRYPTEAGVDAKVALTPSVTLDLTYNTDFAQVEVDDERIDLSRFNTFFPEKRPFFLENAGLFSIGPPGFLELFHSRSIGISPDGRTVPIVGGGRLTGSGGGLAGGGLYLRTGALDGVQEANDFAMGRVQRYVGERSRIGAMYTGRFGADDSGDRNQLVAVDGRIGLGENTFVEGYVSRTFTPGLPGRAHSFYVNVDHEGERWLPRVSYMEVGSAFNPEMGFMRRTEFRVLTAQVQRRIRFPEVSWLREIRPHVNYLGYYDFDGFLETRTVRLRSQVTFENGAFVTPSVVHNTEGLKEPFRIAPGVEIPPGSYRFVTTSASFQTNASAPVSLRGSLDTGRFFSGRRHGASAGLHVRLGALVAAEVRGGYNRVALDEGSFDTRLTGLRVSVTPTPSLFFGSLVQYSSRADLWSTNLRAGWLGPAGTGLFLVYNGAQWTGDLEGPIQRRFLVKFSRQFELTR